MLHGFHRYNLNANVNVIVHKERHVLNKEIVSDESVFSKLNFYSDPIFDKISLIVGSDRRSSTFDNFFFLVVRFEAHNFLYELYVLT